MSKHKRITLNHIAVIITIIGLVLGAILKWIDHQTVP
jgi:hypothetical protein